MEITYQDLNKVCRVCLKGEQWELEDFDLMLLQFYKHLITMPQNRNMEGPSHICKGCTSYLQSILGFYSQCLKNEAIIQTLCKCAKQPYLPLDVNDYEIKSEDTEEKIIDVTAKDDDGATTMLGSKATPENSLNSELMQPHLNATNAMQPTLKTSVLEAKNMPISHLLVETDLIDTGRTASNETPNHQTRSKEQNVEMINKNFTCVTCTLSYETYDEFQAHFAIGCSKSFRQYMSTQDNLCDSLIFKCGTCSNPFGVTSFARHLAVENWIFRFQCTYCGKRFDEPYKLEAHTYGVHFEKPFQCIICLKGYMSKSQLSRHLNNTKHRIKGL